MTVLVSGASGFLGTAVLRQLDEPVVALLRGTDYANRARTLARRTGVPVEGVPGDVRKPAWGLTDRQVDELRERGIRWVVNLAGDVAWSAPWSRLSDVNVDGPANAAALAARLGAGILQAGSLYAGYDYGVEVGEHLLEEREHLTKYERSKLRGELMVARASRRHDLKAVIARIPALSGDMDPVAGVRPSASKVPLARLVMSGWFPALPFSTGARLDICPRDLVAARLAGLLADPGPAQLQVRNVGQGVAAPLVEAFAREASAASRHEPRSFPRPVRAPSAWLKAISRQADRLAESPRTSAYIGLRYFASDTVFVSSGLDREVSLRTLVQTLGMPHQAEPADLSGYYAAWPA